MLSRQLTRGSLHVFDAVEQELHPGRNPNVVGLAALTLKTILTPCLLQGRSTQGPRGIKRARLKALRARHGAASTSKLD